MEGTAATAPVQTGITVAAQSDQNPLSRDTNPYEMRWGFQMAIRDKVLPARECGIAVAPFGEFWPVRSFNTPVEKHTIDWTQPREEIALRPAADCEQSLMEYLAGAGAQGTANWGFMTGFAGVSDAGRMAVISTVLLPKLSQIRSIQQDLGVRAIDEVCPAYDSTMDNEPREECVSCWWAWINSPAVEGYIARVGGQTVFTVNELEVDGTISQREITVSAGELKTALGLIKQSGQQAIKQLTKQWTDITRELSTSDGKQGSRHDISEFEHEYRKDLHKPRPEDRQLELAKAAAGSRTAAESGGNDDLIKALAQSTIATNQAVAKMAGTVEEIRQAVIPANPIPNAGAKGGDAPASTTSLASGAAAMEAAKNDKKKGDSKQ